MFNLTVLTALVKQHTRVARVAVTGTKGSTPREVGAEMFVFAGGQCGTIGGGNLEYLAIAEANRCLDVDQSTQVNRSALGPQLNQCCGGAVTVVTEVFSASTLPNPKLPGYLRRIEGAQQTPEKMTRALNKANGLGAPLVHQFSNGWLLEPFSTPTTQLIIYGAGHVGTALAQTMAPLPEFDVTLCDDRDAADRPETSLPVLPIAPTLKSATDDAIHMVLTHAHDLDFALCHQLLSRQTGEIGLIGSATKWARFRKRLIALGHSPAHVSTINCPIGDPALGKHPQAIAIGVAGELLQSIKTPFSQREAV